MKKLKKLVVSVSGGSTSGYMAYHILTSQRYQVYDKLFLFNNTSQEKEETYTFLSDMVKHWGLPLHFIEGVYTGLKGHGIEARKVNFQDLKKDSSIFRNAIAEYNKNQWNGVPNMATPYCSGILKSKVAHWYAKQYFGTVDFKTALGMRLEDMPRRVTMHQAKNQLDNKIYPMITDFEIPLSEKEILYWWSKQPFKLQIPSSLGNCKLCHKKSEKKLILQLQNGVDQKTLDFYREMEIQYKDRFFRGYKSIEELVELSLSNPDLSKLDDSGDSCFCS